MPDIGLLMSGLSGFNNATNALMQASTNQSQMSWNEKMYGIQRRDALADRDYSNWYNSPAEIMKRMKAGGVNPNLAFGGIAAQGASAQVRSSSPGGYSPKAPQIDIGGVMPIIMGMYQLMQTQAKTDNVKAQTNYIGEMIKLTGLKGNRLNQDIQFNNDSWNNRLASLDYGASILGRKFNLMDKDFGIKDSLKKGMDLKNQYMPLEYKIRRDLADNNIAQAVQRIALMKIQGETDIVRQRHMLQAMNLMGKKGLFQQITNDMARKGMSWNDPAIVRALEAEVERYYSEFVPE